MAQSLRLGALATFATVGTNIQTQLSLLNTECNCMALATSDSDVFVVNLTAASTVKLDYTKQYLSPITYLQAASDGFYIIQLGYIYRYDMQGALQSAYVTLPALAVVELGSDVWVVSASQLSKFDRLTETMTGSYPLPMTVLSACACAHARFPGTLYVAGVAMGQSFGLRTFSVATASWTVVTLAASRVTQCAFTLWGHYLFLATPSATYGLNTSADGGGPFLVYTGQVTDLVATHKNLYLARQNQPVQALPISIEDPRDCGPASYSFAPALPSESSCQVCPAGSVCPGGTLVTSCAPGTYGQAQGLRTQGQCLNCTAGFYCPGGSQLLPCPLGSYSALRGLSAAPQCPLCPANSYCPNATEAIPCPPNTLAQPGSTQLSHCLCATGYKCDLSKVVSAEVTLPLTPAQFEAMRWQYILAIAAAAGVDPSQVVIVGVSQSGLRNAHVTVRTRIREPAADLDLTQLMGLRARARVTVEHEVKSSSKL